MPIMFCPPYPFPISQNPCGPPLTFILELLSIFSTSFPFQGSLWHTFHKDHNLILISSCFSLHICPELFCRYENVRRSHMINCSWPPTHSSQFLTQGPNSSSPPYYTTPHPPPPCPVSGIWKKELRGWPWFLPPLWILVNSLQKHSVIQWPVSESLEKDGDALSTLYHVGHVPYQLWFSCTCFCSSSTYVHISTTEFPLLILA